MKTWHFEFLERPYIDSDCCSLSRIQKDIIRSYIQQTSTECLLSTSPKIWYIPFWFLLTAYKAYSYTRHLIITTTLWSSLVMYHLSFTDEETKVQKVKDLPKTTQLHIRSSTSKALVFFYTQMKYIGITLTLCPNNIRKLLSSGPYAYVLLITIVLPLWSTLSPREASDVPKISIFKNHPFYQGRLSTSQQLIQLTRRTVRLWTSVEETVPWRDLSVPKAGPGARTEVAFCKPALQIV